MTEYNPGLIERRKWLRDRNNLSSEDVVLVVDPNSPRGLWLVGRVLQAIKSKDGVVRKAFIKTSTEQYIRPVAKLRLFETSVKDAEELNMSSPGPEHVTDRAHLPRSNS